MSSRLLPFRRVGGTADELSDEALVAACATGEAAALGALYDRHAAGVRRFLARMAGTDERDLDDLVQDTFAAVPRAARGWGGRAAVRTWLLGVAINIVRHHVRAEVRRRRWTDEAASASPPAETDGRQQVLEQERAAALAAAVLALPPSLREVFVLVYLEGVPGPEVAALVGVRQGTVWKRLHEARARLRVSLQGVRP